MKPIGFTKTNFEFRRVYKRIDEYACKIQLNLVQGVVLKVFNELFEGVRVLTPYNPSREGYRVGKRRSCLKTCRHLGGQKVIKQIQSPRRHGRF